MNITFYIEIIPCKAFGGSPSIYPSNYTSVHACTYCVSYADLTAFKSQTGGYFLP